MFVNLHKVETGLCTVKPETTVVGSLSCIFPTAFFSVIIHIRCFIELVSFARLESNLERFTDTLSNRVRASRTSQKSDTLVSNAYFGSHLRRLFTHDITFFGFPGISNGTQDP